MKIISILLLVLLTSCASEKKTAIKLTKEGDCEGALEHWALAYKEDPKDDEVQDGFRHCQEKVSNDRLVKIRNLRSSHEEERALLEMKSLIELQMRHGMRLDYNSSSFQGKETSWLWSYNKVQLQNLLKDQKPLGADYRQRKFLLVFGSIPDYSATNAVIKTAGAVHCKVIHKGLQQKPFFRSFVDQYCRYFSPERAPGSVSKIQISDVLYGSTNVEMNITGPEVGLNDRLGKSAEEAFEKSPWFHPDSKRQANMKLAGSFATTVIQNWINQTHSYEVSVPYTEYVEVKKTRQVPYTDASNVTRYKTEYYTDTEPRTRYRKDKRFHEYRALKKRQDLQFNVNGQIIVENLPHPFTYTKEESEERIMHDENLPAIGLTPATKDVTKPSDKFDEYRALAGTEIITELNNIWVKSFCELKADRDFSSMGENVTKCRRSPAHPVEFVNTWFINNFGVTAGDAEMIVGRF